MPNAEMINWTATAEDSALIDKIVEKAAKLGKELGVAVDKRKLMMDITACHLNGTPLRLKELLECEDGSFGHDVFGIRRFIDRSNGKMPHHLFNPRFAARQ